MLQSRVDRRVDWEACVNVRDLGGHPAIAGTTKWRSIVRADNLNRLNAAGRNRLVDYGIRTIVDLRDPREVEKFPYPFGHEELAGVSIVNAPLISKANWDWLATKEQVEFLYVMIAKLSAPNIVGALRAIVDAGSGGVVVHCHEGRERTGVIAAILLELAGVADDAIADDWIASMPDSLKARDITAVLDHMRESHGSVSEFLIASGMRANEIEALRLRLRG